jgi:hypothetical protein
MVENMAGVSGAPLFFPVPASVHAQGLSAAGWAAGCDPSLGPAGIRLDRQALEAMGEPEMRQQVVEMLMCLRRQPLEEVVGGAAHSDGTPVIDSMTAVWVLATVGKAFGRPLVQLSSVDRDSLGSVGGVATLIRQAVAPQSAAGAA